MVAIGSRQSPTFRPGAKDGPPAPCASIETDWGEAAIAAGDEGLCRFWMPMADPEQLEEILAADGFAARPTPRLLPELQSAIRRYFAGEPMRFDCRLDLRGFTPFSQRVLRACHNLDYGEAVSYAELARRAGRPRAARAVGTVMSRNPIPLIVPCHRVIRSDGGLGGFGGPEGVGLKRRLLGLEGVELWK